MYQPKNASVSIEYQKPGVVNPLPALSPLCRHVMGNTPSETRPSSASIKTAIPPPTPCRCLHLHTVPSHPEKSWCVTQHEVRTALSCPPPLLSRRKVTGHSSFDLEGGVEKAGIETFSFAGIVDGKQTFETWAPPGGHAASLAIMGCLLAPVCVRGGSQWDAGGLCRGSWILG